jgi:dUTP pyrophosphatase
MHILHNEDNYPPNEIKFIKLHEDAKLPSKSAPERDDPLTGDTGYDVYCVEDKLIPTKSSAVVDTGIQVGDISPGIWYRVEARSGLSFKHGIIPHFGVIDNIYRGIQTVKLYNLSDIDYQVYKGDKICQIVIYPLLTAKIGWIDKPTETHRGEGRLGSTGK